MEHGLRCVISKTERRTELLAKKLSISSLSSRLVHKNTVIKLHNGMKFVCLNTLKLICNKLMFCMSFEINKYIIYWSYI